MVICKPSNNYKTNYTISTFHFIRGSIVTLQNYLIYCTEGRSYKYIIISLVTQHMVSTPAENI